MINSGEIIGINSILYENLRNTLQNYLINLLCLAENDLSEEGVFESMIKMAKQLENNWISDPLIHPFLLMIIEFFNYFISVKEDDQINSNSLIEKINKLAENAL